MFKPCCITNCQKLVTVKCQCSSLSYICEYHVQRHTSTPGQHYINSLLVEVPKNNSSNIRQYLDLNLKIINQSMINLMTFTENLMKIISTESDKLLKKLLKQKKNLNATREMFEQSSKIHTDLIQSLQLNENCFLHQYVFNLSESEKVIRGAYDLEIVNEDFENDDYAIIFPNTHSRSINFLDLSRFQGIERDFRVGEFCHFCICVKIEKMRYFILGGDAKTQSAVKIIDLKTCTTPIYINTDYKLSLAGGCFYQNEVFIFGGISIQSSIKSCVKFNLDTKTFKSIDSLPRPIYSTTAFCKGGLIYVVGTGDDKVSIYDPKKNSFKYMKSKFESKKGKFLIKNFLVCFGVYLLELDKNDALINRQYLSEEVDALNSSAYFKKAEYLYFVTSNCIVYRINTKDACLENLGAYTLPNKNVNSSIYFNQY